MSIIISVLNPKGGSGKTTLSTNLARAFHEKGERVLVVDTDPQGSARDWHAAQDQNPVDVIALDRPENLKTLDTVAKSYDVVLIDGVAKHTDSLAAAIKPADLVLIPMKPSPYDLWSVSDLISLIKTRQEITEGKPLAAFVITQAVSGSTLRKDIVTALGDYGLPTLETPITQRQIYPQTAAEGFTVFDSTNGDARNEVSALAGEINQMMHDEDGRKLWA